MKNEFTLTKVLGADREEVFRYFTTASLLEQWSAPEGMTLRVPKFEAKLGGSYRYEHTGKDGVYLCDGYITEYIPNKKLSMRDTVKGPDGNLLFENLDCTVEFKEVGGGTEVKVYQRGFQDEKACQECEDGWTQCLDKLERLIGFDFGQREDTLFDENQPTL